MARRGDSPEERPRSTRHDVRAYDELFQLLVDNVRDYAIFILDLQGKALTWNAGVERMLGYNQDEFIGLDFGRLFRPSEQADAAREMQVAAANGRSDDERWHVRKDGGELWVTGVLTALRDRRGRLRGYAKIMRDTTLQKAAAAERERLLQRELAAREAAERANRIKDEFLAIVSHELRTPLNAILGWARMLASKQLEPGQATRAIEIIERNAKAQAQLIEDLLDVSRIVTGKLQLILQPVVLQDVVRLAVESVAHTAHEKGIHVTTHFDTDLAPVEGDARRLQQVIWNLLANAIKFTPTGGSIELRVDRHDDTMRLTIRDSGAGIPASELPHIFDRFHQGTLSRRHAPGGLGLGLAIAQHIVEAHGGTIEVHSEGVGKGSTFIVRLPVAANIAPIATRPDIAELLPNLECPPLLEGRSVLVVEDRSDSRELLELILRECGMNVVSVDSARAALTAMDERRFDVIVSDINLAEDEDGLALMRQIRARSTDRGGRVPAIALTAYASASDRTRALAAGFQTHVAKPFEPAELLAAIMSLLGVSGASPGGPSS